MKVNRKVHSLASKKKTELDCGTCPIEYSLAYDLHIHSGLSACCEESMTPNNIVNMAILNELDVIAVTDHNHCGNVASVMEVAKDTDLIVIPGLEVETSEEIHVVCLFLCLDDVYKIQEVINDKLPKFKHKESVLGRQLLYNSEDEIIGKVDQLLAFAANISIDDLFCLVDEIGGIAIPAHIDRPSYSVISNLGMIPNTCSFKTLEISRYADYDTYARKYEDYLLIQSSDAHELGNIGVCKKSFDVKEKSIKGIIEYLKGNKGV